MPLNIQIWFYIGAPANYLIRKWHYFYVKSVRVQVSNFLQKYMFPDEILLEVIMEKTLVEMEFTFFFLFGFLFV